MTSTGGNNPVTLATIAAHLGVSRSTVSNAYNHPDQLSPALREKILATALNLGYTGPDPVARRLRQRKAGAIGVLFAEPLQNAFADSASVLFLEGVALAGEEADSAMLLIPARPSEESAAVVQDAIVDGFILYSMPPAHPFVEAALRRRLPVVCVDQTRLEGVSWVGIDDLEASRQAAQHLVELGHRRIAILVFGLHSASAESDNETPTVSQVRLDGYRKAFEAAGIDWSNITVVECPNNTEADGAAAAAELLQLGEAPTALLCTSDILAIGALNEAIVRGVNVPAQLSVVGFNDLPIAKHSTPPLTTIRQPLVEKGAEATRLLLNVTQAGEGGTIHLDAKLVVRESTAAPQ